MAKQQIIILGAGPAGLGAAYQLSRRDNTRVTVLEKNKKVGGNAGSFEISGAMVDYGSHRLHPSCDPEILKDIKLLLGDELLDRPRHGRIKLRNRWIHFPLKPLDLALCLPLNFSAGVVGDLIRKVLIRRPVSSDKETFASVLETGLGPTICRDFYFPYSSKLWGLPPAELSAIAARRRVSANSMNKIFRKILSAVFGIKKNGVRFFYPRNGFGQISDCLYQAAKDAGAEFYLGARIKSIKMNAKSANAVFSDPNGKLSKHKADFIWSTIPITNLVECLEPPPPTFIINASKKIEYRALILVYLVIEQERFSEYDAHYFPGQDMPITRLSEPKNYSNANEPQNHTVLCAELPCSSKDIEWGMTDDELGRLVTNCLRASSIPIKAHIKKVITRRFNYAYPIYRKHFDRDFNQIDRWLNQVDNLLVLGRQGLFVHDNTHHALYMGYAAAKCLKNNGSFDRVQWKAFRQIFDSHVVED